MAPRRQARGAFPLQPGPQGRAPARASEGVHRVLQADAYAGFDQLYLANRQPGPITPVACWAHARRKLHEVHKADEASAASEGLRLIQALYEVERGITRDPYEDRRRARKLSRLRALEFFAWADDVLAKASARSPLAEALRYAVKLGIRRYLDQIGLSCSRRSDN